MWSYFLRIPKSEGSHRSPGPGTAFSSGVLSGCSSYQNLRLDIAVDDVQRVEMVQSGSDLAECISSLERERVDDVAELVGTSEDVSQRRRAEVKRDVEEVVVRLVVVVLHDVRVTTCGTEGAHIARDEGNEVEEGAFDGDGTAFERDPEYRGAVRTEPWTMVSAYNEQKNGWTHRCRHPGSNLSTWGRAGVCVDNALLITLVQTVAAAYHLRLAAGLAAG